MSDSGDDKKPSSNAPNQERLSEVEQKELIEKLKAQLTLEDPESIRLYAALTKQCSL